MARGGRRYRRQAGDAAADISVGQDSPPAVERGMIRPLVKLLRQMIGWPLEAAILYPLVGILRLLPVQTASFLGVRSLVCWGQSHHGTSALIQYRLCHAETSAAERRRIGRQAWWNMGRVVAEFFQIDQLINKGNITLEGSHHHNPEKGGFLIGAHLGCWELTGTPAIMQNLPVSAVYRRINNPLVTRLLHGRSRVYDRIYEKGREGARGIAETIRKKIFCMLVDQKLREGMMLDFFGHKASTPVAHVKTALRMDTPLLMIQVIRTRGCYHRIMSLRLIRHQGRQPQG